MLQKKKYKQAVKQKTAAAVLEYKMERSEDEYGWKQNLLCRLPVKICFKVFEGKAKAESGYMGNLLLLSENVGKQKISGM